MNRNFCFKFRGSLQISSGTKQFLPEFSMWTFYALDREMRYISRPIGENPFYFRSCFIIQKFFVGIIHVEYSNVK